MSADFTSLTGLDQYLRRGLSEVTTNPLAVRFIRRLANERPEQFEAAAVRYLTNRDSSDGYRLLSAILVRQPGFVDRLTDPEVWSSDEAILLTRRMLEIDPGFDIELARRLPARSQAKGIPGLTGMPAARLIHILDMTSRGARLVPILGHLLQSEDDLIVERAALFVGRRIQRPNLAAKLLRFHDERVRANAVESLWGLQSDQAKKLFAATLNDHSNRVVGNSIVGLRLAGESEIRERIRMISERAESRFRATSAWVIGKTLDAGMLPLLESLTGDGEQVVRRAAENARLAFHGLIPDNNCGAEPLIGIAGSLPVEEPASFEQPLPDEPLLIEEPAMPLFEISLDGAHFATNRRSAPDGDLYGRRAA